MALRTWWQAKSRKSKEETMGDSYLVVGLGNPGSQYEHTRHNIGQMVIDELAHRRQEKLRSHKTNARISQTRLKAGGAAMVLAKSNTYMNLSGGPVAALAKFFNIPAERVIVIHDELDIPFDSIKIKVGGGHAGHNGVRDITKALNTADFTRVRVGIGRPPGQQATADWVLQNFSSHQQKSLANLISDAADAVEDVIESGLLAAQQRWHGRE